MADNTDNGAGIDVATRSVTYSGDAAQNAQVVGLVAFSGSDDAKTAEDIPGDATNGLDVDVTRVGGTVTTNTAVSAVETDTWTSATSQNSVVSIDTQGYNMVGMTITGSGTYSDGVVQFEASLDGGSSWGNTTAYLIGISPSNVGNFSLNTVTKLFHWSVGAFTNFRVRLSTAIVGSGTTIVTLRAGLGVSPYVAGSVTANPSSVVSVSAVGNTAHDSPGTTVVPVAIGGYASAAAPSNVSQDVDIVRAWHLRNGAYAVNLTAAGALIGGDATNGIDADVTRVVPGTGATNLGKAEDAAHTSGDVGVMMLAVRQDSPASLVDTDSDYAPPQLDATGSMRVRLESSNVSMGGGTEVTEDDVSTADPVGGMLMARARASLSSEVAADDNVALNATQKGELYVKQADPVATTHAAASQSDGHSANIGALADADTASTLTGLLKKIKALFNGGLPAALGANGGLKVEGVAGGVAQPVSGTVSVNGSALTALELIDDTVKADDAGFTVATDKVSMAGALAVAIGSDPDAADANDAAAIITNRHRVQFVIGGHPNVVTTKHTTITTAVTDTAMGPTVGTGSKMCVTRLTVTLDNASTVFPTVLIGFGASTTPTTTGVIVAHGGVPAGGGVTIGSGSGVIGQGADGEELRITTTGNATGNGLQVTFTYFLLPS